MRVAVRIAVCCMVGVAVASPSHAQSIFSNGFEPGTRLLINEIESNAGATPDWIELYNGSLFPIDIGGYVLRDSGNGTPYTFAVGTVLQPGQYLVVFPLEFGLGAPDMVRLFSPSTLVDAFGWDAHAAGSWSRCPNGAGEFADRTSTQSTANACN